MKLLFTALFCFSLSTYAIAQDAPRMVRFRTMRNDSINLALNEDYQMIEDSCATMIRYAHYSPAKHIFFGKFKDVSRQNPSLILSEGNYSADGLKDGEFVSRYSNGNLQSKGNYKDNKYDGKWEINFDNGKPRMTFEVSNGVIKIASVWNEKGGKIIDNGKGNYEVSAGPITWVGKLDNGLPDGTWKGYATADPAKSALIRESFKKGVFEKGANAMGEYTNASRIAFIGPDMLPYVTAEKMILSPTACGETKKQAIVYAFYQGGVRAYSEEISRLISAYLSKVDLAPYNDQLEITGIVGKNGLVYNLRYTNAFNEEIARGIINQLRRLPGLQPGTADGKPMEQNITFSFTFQLSRYSFTWRVQPVKS
ncbi:hypothetical protein HQ865_10280 [Mucilaginibacter mali]|uniref:TonB C-terminal domain-containing protein n=1 Tax=Mucilaginibacter mali TaxID=2740462 RepID=A0A7D4QK23_9SPHI|nr:hypothetical protein [Mucilaginibacter mali]QKJ30130.1 hypothetical protein HQ865_10280 [Mucilaginibacter mali]